MGRRVFGKVCGITWGVEWNDTTLDVVGIFQQGRGELPGRLSPKITYLDILGREQQVTARRRTPQEDATELVNLRPFRWKVIEQPSDPSEPSSLPAFGFPPEVLRVSMEWEDERFIK